MNDFKLGDKVKMKNGCSGKITCLRFDPDTQQVAKIEIEQGEGHKMYKIDSVVELVRSY